MKHPRFDNKYGTKIRGVNLGGWLVLEKWMTPSLFQGLTAIDETSYCVELGKNAEQTLNKHWNSFIVRDDFEWLNHVGINAVRIPVGHWLFGDYPYHPSYGENPHPYVKGGIAILDQAFDWADELDLLIIIDLHAGPGCQNGFDNGGIQGVCEWHTQPEFIDHSLKVLEQLAERYRKRPSLHGIEVLNEPRWDIDTEILKTYTEAAYHRIRKHCQADDVAVIYHDGFRPYHEFKGFLPAPEYRNVIFDIHRYQCFVADDINADIYGHIQKVVADWKNEADDIINQFGWTFVGEWSLGLDPLTFEQWASSPFNKPQIQIDDFQQAIAYRAYAAAQLASFEKYLGWFFWSYKTETTPTWSFRESVNRGWLPDKFN